MITTRYEFTLKSTKTTGDGSDEVLLSLKDGNGTAIATFYVNGASKFEGVKVNRATKTADYIATKTDYLIVLDATSNVVVLEFPEPSTSYDNTKFIVDVYNSDNTVVIASFLSTTLDVNTITNTVIVLFFGVRFKPFLIKSE